MKLGLLPARVWQQIVLIVNGYLSASRAKPMALREREALVEQMARKLCVLLLEEDAEADTLALEPGACECGGTYRSHGRRRRVIETIFGTVGIRRRHYQCTRCGKSHYPLDDRWGLGRECLSPLAQERLVGLCVALPFREAHAWFGKLTGCGVSLSTAWRATQRAGAVLLGKVKEEEEASRSREGAIAFLKRMWELGAGGRWGIGADGVYVRVEHNWLEAKVAVLGPITRSGEWIRGRMSYVASMAHAKAFRLRVVRHGLDRGITRRTALVLVSDGAAWIGTLAKKHWHQAVVVRDFWHAVQYLWRGANAIYGEGSQAAAKLAKRLESALWEGKVEEVQEVLVAEGTRKAPRGKQAKQALSDTHRFIENHKEQMRYDCYREERWPIGSGPAEAACKTVVAARMKRSGMNWSMQGAEHMLLLRAQYCTDLATYPLPHT